MSFDKLSIVFKVEYEKVFGLNSLDRSKPAIPGQNRATH
jgi:hypothetical protein